MDGGLAVTLVSIAMFVGCFLLGFIPLLFRLSEVSALFDGDAVLSQHEGVTFVLNVFYLWHLVRCLTWASSKDVATSRFYGLSVNASIFRGAWIRRRSRDKRKWQKSSQTGGIKACTAVQRLLYGMCTRLQRKRVAAILRKKSLNVTF